uniref:Neprosin PEP catalytic domain-containing protein n=1 Tax=Salix viminalis TaxID=40686 RepID=A0A6N2KHE5_SALVM
MNCLIVNVSEREPASTFAAAMPCYLPTVSLTVEQLKVKKSFAMKKIGFLPPLVLALGFFPQAKSVALRLERIQRHLDKINKPAAMIIESPDGDIIDCVHKRKQPALDHPLLKNHKIQREPPEMPRLKVLKDGEELRPERTKKSKEAGGVRRRSWQMWHRNGTRCPRGTVPIRRSTVDDVLRAKSLFDFGKKRRRSISLARRRDAPDVVSGNGHEFNRPTNQLLSHFPLFEQISSHMIEDNFPDRDPQIYLEEVYGAKATINVWDPTIQAVNEFSLSQIWILSGSFNGPDLNSIEAGWQVSPELYGDSRPRLFTYWTSDSYQATGCYNLLCAGFVQTHSRIAIGASISPLSSYTGNQYDISILIWKDPKLGNWWMSFGDGTLVGYWPAELFTHLAKHATMVEWGGETLITASAQPEASQPWLKTPTATISKAPTAMNGAPTSITVARGTIHGARDRAPPRRCRRRQELKIQFPGPRKSRALSNSLNINYVSAISILVSAKMGKKNIA